MQPWSWGGLLATIVLVETVETPHCVKRLDSDRRPAYSGRSKTMHHLTLAILALVLTCCTFETEALDDQLGTSCGHYELDRLTTETTYARYCDQAASGSCFFSADGACGDRRPKAFPGGQELVLWCPIGNPGTESHEMLSCE